MGFVGFGASTGPGIVGVPAGNTPGFSNFTGSNLSNWAAAKANVLNGTSNAKVLDFGDSSVSGYGGAPSNVNAVAFSRMAQLAPLLGHSSISSFFSDHNTALALNTYDNRLNAGSFVRNSDFGFSGSTQICSSGSSPFTFLPTSNVDTFDMYYSTSPGFGTMSWQVDSGSVTNINQNAANTVTKLTISSALGAHTLKVALVSGAIGYMGAIAYNTAVKEISLINAGYASAQSGWLVDNTGGWPWLNMAMITLLAPKLTIIQGGQINDWFNAVPRATSLTNLQTMITTAKQSGTGDVILTTSNPSQAAGSGISYATQQGYVDDMIALAKTNNVPCVDIWRLFGGTWEAANANGYMFDNFHPNGAGYAKIASYLSTAVSTGFISI